MKSNFITVEGLDIHYLEEGAGDVILFLHGWPTSSYLYRDIIKGLSTKKRIIAIDLPGFGKSSKPIEASYSFNFYSKILSSFLKKLNIDKLELGVHDLGGPIGLFWFVNNMEKVERLILFNTLVYPEFSWAVGAFVFLCNAPILNSLLATDFGLDLTMRLGTNNFLNIDSEMVKNVTRPFQDENAKKVLLKTGGSLSPKGFFLIAQKLPEYKKAVKIIYGEKDLILPDVKDTMIRVKKDLPQAEVHSFPEAGHFLQEGFSADIVKILI